MRATQFVESGLMTDLFESHRRAACHFDTKSIALDAIEINAKSIYSAD
jgi:hypothetical protein